MGLQFSYPICFNVCLKIEKCDIQDNYIFTPRVFITIYNDIYCDNRVSSIGICNKSNYF